MNNLAVVGFVGLLVCANAFILKERIMELEAAFDNDVGANEQLRDEGHCACGDWGCWCIGVNDDTRIHVMLSVDEFRNRRCSQAIIDATFFIGKDVFTKQFPADRFEDFCKTVSNKRFCFRIDVNDTKANQKLHGCLRLSRPKKLDMGCFGLPLMTTKCDELPVDDVTNEPDEVFVNDAESDADDLSAYDVSNESDETMTDDSFYAMPVDRLDQSVIEMQAPVKSDSLVGVSDCSCTSVGGCICTGTDDGVKVEVVLSVDELNHGNHKHTLIQGTFTVGDTEFTKRFYVNHLESFCKTVDHKEFCFDIDVKDKDDDQLLHGCMGLTKPKKIELGCFNLPLLMSQSGYDVTGDDADSDETFLISLESDEDALVGVSDCSCSEFGCTCTGTDDGVKVEVVLSVDELNHGNHKHTLIQGTFTVGDTEFTKRFCVNHFESFCKTVEGKKFCFKIDVDDKGADHLHGCMGLTKPKKIELGCFNLPLLISQSGYDVTGDDSDSDEAFLISLESDEGEY